MIDWLGPVIHETYASSEAGMVTVIDSHEALARPGSAGRPIGGAQIRIYGDDGALRARPDRPHPCAPAGLRRLHLPQ